MILVAPDKFKGTFTAPEVCTYVANALRRAPLGHPVVTRPMADGGEGTQAVIMPKGVKVAKGVYKDEHNVCVVAAEVVGRGCYPADMPLTERSSRPLGEAIWTALNATQSTVSVAVGGTMCSDGGVGMLEVIDFAEKDRVVGIFDVHASLVGPGLSALDFAAQKALPGEDLTKIERRLRHLLTLTERRSPFDGAGGGIGFALCSIVGCKGVLGAEVAVTSLLDVWYKTEIVITGEGCLDFQTIEGNKLVNRICAEAERRDIPCIVIAGQVKQRPRYGYVIDTMDFEGDAKQRLVSACEAAASVCGSLL